MKRSITLSILTAVIMLFSVPVFAGGGGSVGISPGTGFKVNFGGGTDFYIPIKLVAEGNLGDEGQHGVGGSFSFDLWVSSGFGSFNLISITPEYKYYTNPRESGAYFGAYADFRLKSNFNIIGVGALGGYQYMFRDDMGIYAEANAGYATAGVKSFTRSHGGEVGLEVGFKYQFGGNKE